MLFDKYVNLIQEAITMHDPKLIDDLKNYQGKILNLYKKINLGGLNDLAESEIDNLKELLHLANKEYKNYINSHMDRILRYHLAYNMYNDFSLVAKKALAV